MKTLRAAVIGLGVGEQHIAGFNAHPGCKVTAVCDFAEEKRKMASERYSGIRVCEDAADVLEDSSIDIVSVASYDNYHYEQIIAAIENGKHIFVEKPLCLYEKQAFDIKRRLDERPELKISSNLILRKSRRFIELKGLVDSGEFGRISYIDGDYNYGRMHKITEGWRGKIDFYSVVYGGAIHLLDLMCWLSGDRIAEAAAYGNRIASEGTQYRYNDIVSSVFRFEGGSTGKVSSNYSCVYPHFHRLNVYGTKASFVNEFEYGKLYRSRDPESAPEKIKTEYPGVKKGDLLYNFVESIVNDTEPEVSKKDVFDIMSVCFAIEKSMKEGKPIEVNYMT